VIHVTRRQRRYARSTRRIVARLAAKGGAVVAAGAVTVGIAGSAVASETERPRWVPPAVVEIVAPPTDAVPVEIERSEPKHTELGEWQPIDFASPVVSTTASSVLTTYQLFADGTVPLSLLRWMGGADHR
jgi:hypothetical protein